MRRGHGAELTVSGMANSFDAPETLEALQAAVAEIERANRALREELLRPPREPDQLELVLVAVLIIETLVAFLSGYHVMKNFDPYAEMSERRAAQVCTWRAKESRLTCARRARATSAACRASYSRARATCHPTGVSVRRPAPTRNDVRR
jgi:hypothetical protein